MKSHILAITYLNLIRICQKCSVHKTTKTVSSCITKKVGGSRRDHYLYLDGAGKKPFPCRWGCVAGVVWVGVVG